MGSPARTLFRSGAAATGLFLDGRPV